MKRCLCFVYMSRININNYFKDVFSNRKINMELPKYRTFYLTIFNAKKYTPHVCWTSVKQQLTRDARIMKSKPNFEDISKIAGEQIVRRRKEILFRFRFRPTREWLWRTTDRNIRRFFSGDKNAFGSVLIAGLSVTVR